MPIAQQHLGKKKCQPVLYKGFSKFKFMYKVGKNTNYNFLLYTKKDLYIFTWYCYLIFLPDILQITVYELEILIFKLIYMQPFHSFIVTI